VITTCYATRNRRAPFVGLIGIWPHRSGFYRMAQAGVRVLVRRSHREEREAAEGSPRHMAMRWPSLLCFVRWHRHRYGKHGQAVLIGQLRAHWSAVADCIRDQRRKAGRHAAKLAKRRGDRSPPKPAARTSAKRRPAKQQGWLFDPDQVDESLPIICPGAKSVVWIRRGCPPAVVWWLGNTGWRVEQCGHPTALWPWAGYDAEGWMIKAPNGRAFDNVRDSKAAVLERYLAAELARSARAPPAAA
jgi:hypothetical protein